MKTKLQEFIVRKHFNEWLKKNKVGEKIANTILFGKPLVINKKTGKVYNELPKVNGDYDTYDAFVACAENKGRHLGEADESIKKGEIL